MKTFIILLAFTFSFFSCQKKEIEPIDKKVDSQEILITATILYKNQLAYWQAGNMVNDSLKIDWNKFGDIFSYGENEDLKCIFLSNDSVPKVLAEVVFDSLINQKGNIIYTVRNMTQKENDLTTIRNKAMDLVSKDKFPKQTKDMMLEYIAVMNNNEKSVYVFPTSIRTSSLFYGNDCKIVFDKTNKFVRKDIYHSKTYKVNISSGFENFISHDHSTNQSKLMTPTDLCISMLAAKEKKIGLSYVKSKDYISIWNNETKKLVVDENNGSR